MSRSAPPPGRARRQTGLALLEIEELLDQVARKRSTLEETPAESALDALRETIDRVEIIAQRMREALGDAGGVSVEQAAERLNVTSPTVRKWIREGFLETVPERKPVEVTASGVIQIERVLAEVREAYPSRDWTRALGAFLHDRDLLAQKWAREGIEQAKRGEFSDL
jgi:DNA-binding transcriptional MerR regulator